MVMPVPYLELKNKKNQNFLYSFITSIHSYIHTHPLHYIHTQLQPYTSLYIHSSIHKELVTLRYAGRLKSMLAKIVSSILLTCIFQMQTNFDSQLLPLLAYDRTIMKASLVLWARPSWPRRPNQRRWSRTSGGGAQVARRATILFP